MSSTNAPTHDDPAASTELNPHQALLADAAAAVQADQAAREARRPQNVGQGTLSLVGDSLGGVAVGAAAVVMGPVQGYKVSGPKGILGGALSGLAVGVAATTLGVGSGIAKFAQGTGKTLESLQGSSLPEKLLVMEGEGGTDRYKKERTRLYGELLADGAAGAAGGVGVLQPPVENELYDVLEVGVDASPGQIRKAYYRMAQRYHPDKHPDDKNATAKFQKISEAYQVLSDPVKREEYHRVGAAAATDAAMMDPKALFALMFSDFEHIVGDLATATILSTMELEAAAANAQKPEGTVDESQAMAKARAEKRAEFQNAREAHLVTMLNRRLEAWLRGDENAFIEHAKVEVRALRAQPFGRDLLKTAAYVYKKQASKALDHGPLKGVNHFFDDIGDKAHSLKSQLRALEGGVKALSEAATTGENESLDEAARREAVSTLGAVWLASVIDIEKTLKHVVSKVLHVEGQGKASQEILSKAEGLLVLSQIFKQA